MVAAPKAAIASTLAAIVVASALSTAGQDLPQPTARDPRRLALLVGVTDFIAPAMKKHNLRGPANDVALFRALLTGDRFRVPADAIVSLAGLPDDAAARPTRANIAREFRRLQDTAGPGDQVLIFLAGHGSQQPADADPADEEPDGLDEIFLPADTEGWSTAGRGVTNAIVDDEIRQWVAGIRGKGAIVTIIVDACHSGTITRAAGTEWRDRGIPIEDLIPPAALANIRARGGTRSATPTSPRTSGLSDAPGDVTALYAADMSETTPELAMPDRTGPMQGLFTYTLTRILSERTGPMTYRELVHRVIDQYRGGGFNPTPSLEGSGADRDVLGDRTPRQTRTFSIDTRGASTNWTIDGGSIDGLTRESILEIRPSNDGLPIGYMRVVAVRPTSATVTPVAFRKMPAPRAARVTAGHRARIAQVAFGALRMRVALQQSSGAVLPPGRGPRALERALSSLPQLSDGLAQRVSADADWFLRVDATRVVLTAAWRAGTLRSTSAKRFDVGALDDPALAQQLADVLKRIARAANLARLATHVDPQAALRVDIRRFNGSAADAVPLPADDGDPGVVAGDRLQFVIRNVGSVPLDLTVLYVDANLGIWPLFPRGDSALDNRIEPGGQRSLDPEEITADPVGWESVVAIGVEATPRHENFVMLAQDSLVEAQRSSAGPASPLRALLESALFGTRAAAPPDDGDRGRFAISQTWFRVDEAER